MKRILVIIFVFGIVQSGYAQQRSISERQQLWSEFMSMEGNNWRVQWNEHNGVPKALYNGVSKSYQGSPETIARQFLREHRELFFMKEDLTDLEYVRTQTNRGVHHGYFPANIPRY